MLLQRRLQRAAGLEERRRGHTTAPTQPAGRGAGGEAAPGLAITVVGPRAGGRACLLAAVA